jgi:hypothetical protein
MRRAAVWLRVMNAVFAAEVPAGMLRVEPGLTGVTHGIALSVAHTASLRNL